MKIRTRLNMFIDSNIEKVGKEYYI